MSDNTALNNGDIIASDDVTTLNGNASSGVKVQRVKTTFGVDGVARDVSDDFPLPTTSSNISTKFREAFESYTPGVRWTETKASGDLVCLDGNALAASYLVISKSPLMQNNETSVESLLTFNMPIELSFGAHMSQRTLGQEFSFEVVDTDPPMADVADLAIASISQTTTVLTVNTTLPHGLSVGKSVGIMGVADSRANYPALVVYTVPTPKQFTCIAGPMGGLTSLTIAQVNNSGYVFFRERLGRANNGVSQIFENNNAGNASFYVRSEGGDAFPSGTFNTTHGVGTGNSSSIALATAPYTYAFSPTNEFRINIQSDKVQCVDVAIDSLNQANHRITRTQVCPNLAKTYKLRVRTKNAKSLTVPVAQIVSVVKTGTTTATITFDRAHGLTLTDQIVAYGVRDQTNFANLTTVTAIASIVNTTTITVVWGTAVTATSYGGYVARVNGGNLMSGLGALTMVAQSAVLTAGVLTLVGNTTWAGTAIGNSVELVGIRNISTGASLGLDGAYKVRNLSTTTLELEPIAWTPPTVTLTNCGGGVINRTDLRISFVRIFDYERLRVEALARPGGDNASTMPVTVQNTAAVTISGTPVVVNAISVATAVTDVASAAITTTTTTAAITPSNGSSYEVNIPVTLVSGTAPTMDVVVQESDDGGVNYFDVYHFPRITATGMYRSPKLPLLGNRLRYVQTITGTTPSFTRIIYRLQSHESVPVYRQAFDRTIVLTTLSSVTPVLDVKTTKNVELTVNIGAATTAPVLKLQGTDDNGASWIDIGAPLSAVASSTVKLTVNNVAFEGIRAIVSTAGTAVTAGYVKLKGY